ncbi:MAG: FmdB family zinc ribbon protein [Nitrospiraceae bacterium]
MSVPIYEYVCQSCQHRFEVKQSLADPPLSSCERCGKAVTKVISASAIMFKGTGWYVTDYSDKLRPSTESKTDETSSPAKKEEKVSSESTAATGTTAPAASGSSSGSSDSPSTAGSSAPPAAPATPSSSSK